MKIQLLAATAVLAMFTATTASAGKLVITTTNTATNSVAVGNAIGIAAAGGGGGFAGTLGLTLSNDRAEAGSVLVDAVASNCNCKRIVTVVNTSNNSVALGNGSAGSTAVRL